MSNRFPTETVKVTRTKVTKVDKSGTADHNVFDKQNKKAIAKEAKSTVALAEGRGPEEAPKKAEKPSGGDK